ncbi:MAG: inner membrane protein YhjD, partial [Mycobacteriaceae bacterium]|nr:inner membrane protein YhjD [Mycobacteriaceae bacterium]
FALFPLAMVGFAGVGFVLARRPDLVAEIEDRIKRSVSGEFGQQLVKLMDAAINSRTSLGIIGIAVALWAGLGWMANLRQALTAMWGGSQPAGANFFHTKLSDLLALLSAFVAILVTIGLTAVADAGLVRRLLRWIGISDVPGLGLGLRLLAVALSLAISWLLFTWMIARLPRQSLSFASSMRAGLLAAIGFEIFKQVASIYLRAIIHGPAGATFGPVLGLMVFAYITARLILFSTAWAATSADNLVAATVPPPAPAVITTQVRDAEGLNVGQGLAAVALGALAALGISWARRK